MLTNYKTAILYALETFGWSLEELDYRINEPEGLISDFISNDYAERLSKPIENRIKTLLPGCFECFEKGTEDLYDEKYLIQFMQRLSRRTVYGNLKWTRICGQLGFRTTDDNGFTSQLRINPSKKNGEHESPFSDASDFHEAGPTYHCTTPTGLHVFISGIRDKEYSGEMHHSMLGIYLSDKRGRLLDYYESGIRESTGGYNDIEFLIKSETDDLYRSIMEYHGDSFYESVSM